MFGVWVYRASELRCCGGIQVKLRFRVPGWLAGNGEPYEP